ncbi:hypothetical protein AB0I81_20330 [Nonomuraea sp. NPDC050404]|uniref:hypothetical protein n=1 Tax=Nonomuraea sp. NPDC050404 TaxID=3155783 RepID=UPI0033EB8A5C
MDGDGALLGGNTALAVVLAESGCSHGALANRVNELTGRQGIVTRYDKASVTRWIQGMQPRGQVPEFIAAALGERLGRSLSLSEIGFLEELRSPVATRSLAYGEEVGETLRTLAELSSTDLSRRQALGAVPFVAAALVDPQRRWLLWLLEDDQATHLTAVTSGGPVERVYAMIAMFDEMDNRFGGGQVRTSVVHYLSAEVVPLLHRSGTMENQRRELFTAAAKLSAMAGWSSYDSAEYGLAERYMIQALRLCAEGGDRVLGGQILAGLSHLATSLGRPDEGVALARSGLVTAKQAGSPLGLMRLHAMAARGHAALNQSAKAAASLNAAERALETSVGPEHESPWVRFLDHHYLEAEAAHCFRDLGDAQRAEHLADDSVRANTDRRRRRAISQAVLATAHLQQNRLDQAIDSATTALGLLDTVHSERSVQALRDFRGRLEAHRAEPLVRQFERRARPVLGAA